MKKFLSGFLVSTLVFGLAISALAVSGNVSFNLSAIKFNGEVISEAGEGYALSNGCVAPASITYTDEKGGGTTYLPARRVSELLGVDIDWDSASGAVTIGSAAPATPNTTAPAADYSDWSAEEEAAYQEWKAMWTFEPKFSGYDTVFHVNTESYNCNHLGTWNEAVQAVETGKQNGYFLRLMDDLRQNYERVTFFLRCEAGDEDGNKLIQWLDPKPL